MSTLRFKTNINCGSCIKKVTPHLNELDEVDSWKVNTDDPDKILEIELEEGDSKLIIDTVKGAGFSIEEI